MDQKQKLTMVEEQEDSMQVLFNKMTLFEQYVDEVVDYTSRYNSTVNFYYSPINLTGKATRYPAYGDFTDTYMMRSYGKWWNQSEGAQEVYVPQDVPKIIAEDYVTVRFRVPVIPLELIIYETYNPGAIVRIWARRSEGRWHVLWEEEPQRQPQSSRRFCPKLRPHRQLVNEIRLDLNQSLLTYYTAFDAILLSGRQPVTPLQFNLLEKGLMEVKISKEPTFPDHSSYDDNKISPFSKLPYEVIVHIFTYLDMKSLCRCAQVNKSFELAAKDAGIYRNLCLKHYWHKVDDNLMQMLTKRCRMLRKLDLSWCGNGSVPLSENSFIRFLKSCCSHLTHLSLCHCLFVTQESFGVIGTFKDLVDLRLKDSCPIPGAFILLDNLHNLVSIDFSGTNIADDQLMTILRANPNLKHVNIDLCEYINRIDVVLEVVSIHNRNLVTWHSWKTRSLTANGVKHLARCPNLRELDLGWCMMTRDPENCLELVAKSCGGLKRLILSGWRGMTDQNLRPLLRYCRQLTQLDLVGMKYISGEICNVALTTLPNLQLLDISFCEKILPEEVKMWREKYPNVTIQRSCEFTMPDVFF